MMTPPSNKRRADDEPASSPPPKRPRSEKQTPPPPAAPQSSSPPRKSSSAAFGQTSSLPTTRSVSASLDEEATNPETDALLCRIQTGISYTLSQHYSNSPIAQTTRFRISTTKPSSFAALNLLRTHATLIASSVSFEVFETGIPRPDWVSQGILPGIHDPQWWVGKSVAEVKAGPWADEFDVKRAEARVRGCETKRIKGRKRGKGMTKREKESERKLREGLRRQERGLRMGD